MPGISTGNYKITVGTFGCVVYRNEDEGECKGFIDCLIRFLLRLLDSILRLLGMGAVKKKYILSNNHVLADTSLVGDPDIRGDAVLQPGPADNGKNPQDRIAKLYDYVEIDPDGCYVDCAIAEALNNDDVTCEILEVGAPNGVAEIEIGEDVKKSGRTTGLTAGKVLYKNVDIKVDYTKAIVLCKDQILCSAMSEGGDSGSVVLDENNNIVGLLFAGSSQFTIVNPIQRVLEELDVNIMN